MAQYTIQIDNAVAETVRETARRLQLSEEQCAAEILIAHHEEFRRFPDGVLREGRQKIIALLSQIPCLSDFRSSGVDFRYWWVSFELDMSSPIAWLVVNRLGWYLNTESAEMMLPVAFKPMPGQRPNDPTRWEIAFTAPRFDPAEVARWLSDHLPQPISDTELWLHLGKDDDAEGSATRSYSERRFPDLEDCEKIGQKHKWFNLDNIRSSCYHCRVVREGQLWKK